MEDFVGKSRQCIPCNLLKYTPPQIFFYEKVSFKQILRRRPIQEHFDAFPLKSEIKQVTPVFILSLIMFSRV